MALAARQTELSRGEARAHRLKLKKDIERRARELDRQKIAELRAALKEARKRLREEVSGIRSKCRTAREELRAKLRAEREAVLTELREAHRAQRAELRNDCALRRERARARHADDIARAAALEREERRYQRELARADKRFQAKTRIRATAKERAQESDDQVRSNIDPDLLVVFEQVKGRIKAGPRRTRTEAFLEWVQENPSEVLAIQSSEAEADVARLIREHEKAERAAERRRKRGYKLTRAELEQLAAEVPF